MKQENLRISSRRKAVVRYMDLIEIFNNHFPKISQKQIVLFLILSILLAAVLIFMVQRKIIKTGQAVCIAGVFVWLYIVFLSTVFSRNPYPEMKYELMPFWSYVFTIQYRSVSMAEEIFLNVLLLMPMGVLLYAAFGRRVGVMKITAAGLSVSFCIEFLQLVLKRGLFEWDDMIHNTLGVYLGCWICKKIMDVCKKR